jgi:hypothetical protein
MAAEGPKRLPKNLEEASKNLQFFKTQFNAVQAGYTKYTTDVNANQRVRDPELDVIFAKALTELRTKLEETLSQIDKMIAASENLEKGADKSPGPRT